jgi:hypothetical protein
LSGLINGLAFQYAYTEDLRLNRQDFQPMGQILVDFMNFVSGGSFFSEWWPYSSNFAGDNAVDMAMIQSAKWSEIDFGEGASSRFGFVGTTRDANGTPVPSCTVKLYRTSDDSLLDNQTSDPVTGVFLLNTPYYPDQHYIVAHKSGSPDIDGVSPNTLIGS